MRALTGLSSVIGSLLLVVSAVAPAALFAASLFAADLFAAARATAAEPTGPPPTRKSPQTDTYHGTDVSEDYRWLEDASDAEVKQWTDAQNQYARTTLDSLPGIEAIRDRVTQILSAETIRYGAVTHRSVTATEDPAGLTHHFFATKLQPPQQQPVIIGFDSPDQIDQARTLVDPNQIDPSGGTSIDWYKVSPDAQRLAVSLSSGGSETGDVTIYDVATGMPIGETITGVNSGTAGGSLAWLPDSSGFFYTRHLKSVPDDPNDHSVYQQVYLHRLGTSVDQDTYELGKGFPAIAEIQLVMDDISGRLLATVQEGDGGNFAHHLRDTDGVWRQFSNFGDGVKQAVFGPQGELYVVTLHEAPRGRIVRLPIDTLDMAAAETVVPMNEDAIVTGGVAFWGETTVLPLQDRIYVVYQLGGPSELRAFDYEGRVVTPPKQLPISAIDGLLAVDEQTILFGNVSFTQPHAYYRFNSEQGKTIKTALATTSPATLADAEVIRRFALSEDGTKVPLNIVLPAGVGRDGDNPTLVYGYGGYGVNIEPSFNPLNRILMDHGVIYAVANLRGGGEYGERWHKAGNLTRKQNVFDDFAACVSFMTQNGYTTPERTAILGGSNGGLLMGAMLTQHPKRVAAVVSLVGIYDMLRVELSPNGAFNVTEFGSVKDPDQFAALRAYSPYHNVDNDTAYPAVLLITGENDPRVDPMQSRKMAARLQAASNSGKPILLRTSADAGHGGGNSLQQQIEQAVHIYAFLFAQLGITPQPSTR